MMLLSAASARAARLRHQQVMSQAAAPGEVTINGVKYDCASVAHTGPLIFTEGGKSQKRELVVQIFATVLPESVFRDVSAPTKPLRPILLVHAGVTYRLKVADTDGHGVMHHLSAEEDNP